MNIVTTFTSIRTIFTLLLTVAFLNHGQAQEFRTINGTNNNLANPLWGSQGHQLSVITDIAYADGVNAPGGETRPNPRVISNTLFDQFGLVNDQLSLSDYVWVFGQFLDHDITQVKNSAFEPALINVPIGDPWFDPFDGGEALIFMMRSAAIPGTGTSAANPRAFSNNITAFIDGSAVYGSTDDRAVWLRTGYAGKLKTSSGNLLPFNTTNNEFSGEVDHDVPEMDDDVGLTEKFFVAGDSRANENPLLIAFHTLFVREHNRLCDEILIDFPGTSDEEVYQIARKKVGALIQAIVYEEWLPVMGIHLDPYIGYDPAVNPGITNVFSGAAFRMGHTLLNSNIIRLNNDGTTIAQGNLLLRDAFFNPLEVLVAGGIDPLFKGMATQIEQEFDCKVIDDVRNFLFGPPGYGGLDLASININRGRERGIADFNTIRANLGLGRYDLFEEIVADQDEAFEMETLYEGDINNIDPWVGMLAEEHMPGALMGETVMEIMKIQFGALRDGDRFYYKNDPFFSLAEIEEISATTLHDIIMRNTEITLMQHNVFEAMPHDSISACGAVGPLAAINGFIHTETGETIGQVQIDIANNSMSQNLQTEDDGAFAFSSLVTCDAYTITPEKNLDPTNGVTTIDLVFIQRHILGISALDSPYKILAADVDGNENITTLDMVHLRRLILNIVEELPNGTPSWKFVSAMHIFSDPANPFADDFDNFVTIDELSMPFQRNFIGYKMGDVNNNAIPNNFTSAEDRNKDMAAFDFNVKDQVFKAGDIVNVPLHADLESVMAWQFTLDYDDKTLEYLSMDLGNQPNLTEENFGIFKDKAAITASWNAPEANTDDMICNIQFQAKADGHLSNALRINSDMTMAYVYQEEVTKLARLNFDTEEMLLHQNYPNPFVENTIISFVLPEATATKLRVYNFAGVLVHEISGDFVQGYNEAVLMADDLAGSGIFYYQLESEFATVTKKMTVVSKDKS